MKDQQNKEQSPVVSISGKDKKFLAAILFFQTSILCVAISISGTWHSHFLNKTMEHKLKIKNTLNKLEGDIEIQRQTERYKAQGISTEDVK